jgi:aminoglycoside phosphotransferase (APT) family kinase protein
MTPEPDDRQRTLSEWSAAQTGEPSVALLRRPGGGSHQAWDVIGESGRKWFLRADAHEPAANQHYTLRREADVYRAVHAIGLPTPAVIGVHPTMSAVLLERSDGDAAFARLDAAAQTRIIDDFAPWLAKMHAADPTAFGLDALGDHATIGAAVLAELDRWEARLDSSSVPDPVLTACFVWLRANVPDTGHLRPSLVQGDTGPGNFLHDGARVTAFLDFELAHLGDPMEDIAWVGTRNAQEPVPDFDRFIQHYAAATGIAPDPERIRYHALFAELRIAVLGTERQAGDSDLEAEHGNRLIYGALHRRLTVEALAAAMGVAMPDVSLPTLVDTDDTRYFDAILHQMHRRIGPEIVDPYPARLLKGLARVVKYLREVDRAGTTHEAAELDRLEAVLGVRPACVADGLSTLLGLVRDGTVGAADLLPYAATQVALRTQVVGPAMGVLATRHLPPF